MNRLIKLKIFFLMGIMLSSALMSSCARKPQQLYDDGMKSFATGKYEDALDDFSDGIKKDGDTKFYCAFIAANLVTGKYPAVNSAYNQFSDDIRSYLKRFLGDAGLKRMGMLDLIPYKVNGGNTIPPDFPTTVALQSLADYQSFLSVKQEIDISVKK